MRRPIFPPNTLALPYDCQDESCGCRSPYSTEPYRAKPGRTDSAWEVFVFDRRGDLVDVIRDRDLQRALILVHECYPAATFDPEA